MKVDEDFYKIDQEASVEEASSLLKEENIRAQITKLSSFKNRYYQSSHGKASQEYIRDIWDAELIDHKDFMQASVRYIIKGSELPEEIIVLGAHGDSISGWRMPENGLAPGADDNASGLSTLTEILRILKEMNFTPKRSIHFFSYAAEEVGLVGSKKIAQMYKQEGKNVKAVLQFDMTNYEVKEQDLVLITDYTNQRQNQFLKDLLKKYQSQVKYKEAKCGYACSDHASWDRYSFPASFPFEADMESHNPHIHTKEDTIQKSSSHAKRTLPYARLGLAFALELSM